MAAMAAGEAGEVICRIHFNAKNKTQNKNCSEWFKMVQNDLKSCVHIIRLVWCYPALQSTHRDC